MLPHAAAGSTLPALAEPRVRADAPLLLLLLLWEEVMEGGGYPGGQSNQHLEVGQRFLEGRRVGCGG